MSCFCFPFIFSDFYHGMVNWFPNMIKEVYNRDDLSHFNCIDNADFGDLILKQFFVYKNLRGKLCWRF